MRIIGGLYKGKVLYQPKDKFTRPLKDITKESIFNLINHSKKINIKLDNLNILDIFSGTGSFGLECISRGAKKVTFIEKHKPIINILKKNINNLKISDQCSVIEKDCFTFINNIEKFDTYDFIFLDPPFKFNETKNLIDLIIYKKLIKKKNLLTIHRHRNSKDYIHKRLIRVDERIYGKSKISFFKLI